LAAGVEKEGKSVKWIVLAVIAAVLIVAAIADWQSAQIVPLT
jgi:hypothetical protein